MLKRLTDICFSLIGLIIFSPVLLIFCFLIWLQDFNNPFYISSRVGRLNKDFKLIKLRSMVVNADSSGVDSTSTDDKRITKIGSLIRQFKIDEIPQLINVFLGQMSFVGPRPNVRSDVNLYTKKEELLLIVKPGITDFSSIIFSDEGEILAGSEDPDLKYNQIIRPWKSRLGILYIQNASFLLDFKLLIYTLVSIFWKDFIIELICKELRNIGADKRLIEICTRKETLTPHPPPGTDRIFKRVL